MKVATISQDMTYNVCMPVNTGLSWYALRTRSNYEKITASFLEDRGFEQFLPLYRMVKRRPDRVVENRVPLFPGYLFCRFDERYRTPILGALGVVSIVAFGGKPARIDDMEIEAIRRALGSGQNMEPYPYLHEGQRIRVEKGPLQGLEGILIKKRSWRIVISVQMLMRAVAVEIDPDSVTPIDRCEARSETGASSPDVCRCERPEFDQPAPVCMEAQRLPAIEPCSELQHLQNKRWF